MYELQDSSFFIFNVSTLVMIGLVVMLGLSGIFYLKRK